MKVYLYTFIVLLYIYCIGEYDKKVNIRKKYNIKDIIKENYLINK